MCKPCKPAFRPGCQTVRDAMSTNMRDAMSTNMRDARLLAVALWAVALLAALALTPRTSAQAAPLTPFIAVEGRIDAPGATQSYQFIGQEGAIVSLLLRSDQPADGVPAAAGLDPVLRLQSSSGTELLSSDDYAPDQHRDALLQGITLPRADTYTVIVSGYGPTTGNYALTLYEGYADLRRFEAFDDAASWEAESDVLSISAGEGALALRLDIADMDAFVVEDDADAYAGTHYVRAEFEDVLGRSGWRVGLTLTDDGSTRRVLMLNERGQWRLVARDEDGERVIRDWSLHPAIRPGETQFTLAALVNGAAVDAFYNGAFIGQAVDETGAVPSVGPMGFYVGSPSALGASVSATLESLVITSALQDDGARIVPQQLMPGSLGITVQELERRGLIPVGGVETLSVLESSGWEVTPGVNRIVLGRGTRFSDMVLSTTFTLQADMNALVGCGLLWGNVSETQHGVAFRDRSGAYGLSLREGDRYLPGVFGTQPWVDGPQHLLVVRVDEQLYYYVNRQWVGTLTTPMQPGEVGNVVINYEPAPTNCEFSDTWVWSWP